MKNSFWVRKAVSKDGEKLANFNIAMAKETENKDLDFDTVIQGVKAVMKDSGKGFYIVAQEKVGSLDVIGQLMVTYEWSDWTNKYYWWIQSVYVDPKHRRKSVFSQMLSEVVNLASSSNDVYGLRLYVENNNLAAKSSYKIFGFQRTSYELYELNL